MVYGFYALENFMYLITRRTVKGYLYTCSNSLADSTTSVCSFKSLHKFSQIKPSSNIFSIFYWTFFSSFLDTAFSFCMPFLFMNLFLNHFINFLYLYHTCSSSVISFFKLFVNVTTYFFIKILLVFWFSLPQNI